MKQMTFRIEKTAAWKLWGAACLAAWMVQASPAANLVTPLNLGCMDPVVDEMGRTLVGSSSQPGDAVQILQAVNGVIHPPSSDGTPHPENVVIGTSSIGNMAPAYMTQPGIFSMALADRSDRNGQQIFVRVFNAGDPSEASFYGDSQLHTVALGLTENVFVADITATDKPLDTADDDLDGLANSMELAMGTNPFSKDTDGDGMMDSMEKRAGTDALDKDSALMITRLERLESGGVRLYWDAVEGMTYQVWTTRESLKKGPLFVPFNAQVTATGSEASTDVPPEWVENGRSFRVQLVD